MPVILDGTGAAFSAEVDSTNRLAVKATQHSREHAASVLGDAFVLNTATTAKTLTLATGNTYNLLYMENSSTTQLLVVQKLEITSNTAGVVGEILRNPVLGAVSANNVEVPINHNFGSAKAAAGVFHSWDETGTTGIGGITGGTTTVTSILPVGGATTDIDGAGILTQGDTAVVLITNGTGGSAEVTVMIRFYYIAANNA